MMAVIYKRLLQLGKVAGTLTFLFGIPYGIWQYWEKSRDARVEQSLKLFDKFNSSPISGYREQVSKALGEGSSALVASAKDPAQLRESVLKLVAEKQIEPALWLLMDFYDGVAVCVVNRICDTATVTHLFGPRAQDLFVPFYPYIKDQRRGPTSTFAVGLETVARSSFERFAR